MSPAELRLHIEGCSAAHTVLLAHLRSALTDDVARSDSLLDGWSVGHVVTHLARNADAHVRMVEAAGRGERVAMYDSREARTAGIEEGAGRAADDLLADLAGAVERLESAWAACSAVGWDGTGVTIAGEMPIADGPFLRWREVEVHHADLGLPGFGIADWSARYVCEDLRRMEMIQRSRLPMGIGGTWPEAARRITDNERLAWLFGRIVPDGLEPLTFP